MLDQNKRHYVCSSRPDYPTNYRIVEAILQSKCMQHNIYIYKYLEYKWSFSIEQFTDCYFVFLWRMLDYSRLFQFRLKGQVERGPEIYTVQHINSVSIVKRNFKEIKKFTVYKTIKQPTMNHDPGSILRGSEVEEFKPMGRRGRFRKKFWNVVGSK